MPKLFYGHVMNKDVRIHYYRTGDTKPPVILLHGITDNGLCWNQVALGLELEYDVIMIDARGHGLSSAPEMGYSQKDQATDVLQTILELQLIKPAIIGHSMGAATAAVAAAEYPDLVGSVVLVDPPWKLPDTPMDSEEYQRESDNLRNKTLDYRSKSMEELVAIARQRHPTWDEEDIFLWAKSKQQVRPTIVNDYPFSPGWQETAGKLQCPVMLVTGDPAHGAIVTPEVAKEVSSRWKKGKVVQIPVGHSIHREAKRKFMEELYSFLIQRRVYKGQWL